MIALLEYGLRGTPGLAHVLGKPGALILYGPPEGHSSDHWRTRDQRESRPLVDWLGAELDRLPTVNRVLVAWRRMDPRLPACLQSLASLPHERYKISLTLLLAGPLINASDVENQLSAAGLAGDESPLQSVLFLGNEDQKGRLIDDGRRSEVVGDLVTLLASTGDAGFAWLGLESGVTRGTVRSFGLRRWGSSSSDMRSLVERTGHDVLRMELSAAPSPGFDKDTLESNPDRRLQELRTFGVPLGSTSDPSQTSRLTERVSTLPINPFEDWPCPAWRKAASRDGKERIDGHVPAVYGIHRRLVEELPALATAIRSNGHDFFTKCRVELRDEIERATRLGDVAALLRHYFPAISRLRRQSPTGPRHPCAPADDPTLAACLRRYRDDASERLDELVLRLPTGPRVLALYSGAGLLFAGGGFALARAVAPALSAVPAVLGLGLGVGTWLWSRWQARKVAEAMKDYFDEADRWLRGSFVAKLEWVLAKTQQTLEAQYMATGEAIGRALGRSFESVFREWQTMLKDSSCDRADEELRSLGVDDDTIETIKERFRSLAREIVGFALNEDLGTKGRADLEPVLEVLTAQVIERLADRPVPESAVEKDLISCAAQRLSPTLCARIGDAMLVQNLRKTFVAPTSYTDGLLSNISRTASPTGVEVVTARTRIRGPAAWLLTPALNREDFAKALEATQI